VQELLESPRAQRRIAVIFNPVSGTDDPAARRARLEQRIRDLSPPCALHETDRERGAAPLAREAVRDGVERLLVYGGDGSVVEAAEALAGTDAALAVVPGGTGNLLSINLGIPLDFNQAMDLALNGETRRIDVGRANGHPFLIVAGMGADAEMIREADRETKQRFGFLAYFMAAWKHFRRPFSRYTITVDGKRYRRNALTVMVANLGRITAGLELVPGADPTDGILEVSILRARTLSDVFAMAWRVLTGERRSDSLMEVHRGRHILIQSGRPLPVEVDGNELGETRRLEVTVDPGALRIVAPPEGTAGLQLLVPTVPVETALPLGAAVLVGGVTALALSLHRHQARRAGKEPRWWARQPHLAGAAAAAGTLLAAAAVRRVIRRRR
jgi:YegS/Rv2252/BmrU family lipid kinase